MDKWHTVGEAFELPADQLARLLIGCQLRRTLDDGSILAGLITETEAYLGPEDRASHAFGGRRTERNASMWDKPGTAYVYFTYGMHHCFNVSCGKENHPAAVLIRGIQPTLGMDIMRTHRTKKPRKNPLREKDLCNGPAKLCQAMRIDRTLDGIDLLQSAQLTITEGINAPDQEIQCTPRIGVGYAQEWRDKPLRWIWKPQNSASNPPGDAKRSSEGCGLPE
jgi:DNA-3-methyladenine glycosylase